MAQHQVRRLPVVEEDGQLVGVVAQADVAEHAIGEGHRRGRRGDLEVRRPVTRGPPRRASCSFYAAARVVAAERGVA